MQARSGPGRRSPSKDAPAQPAKSALVVNVRKGPLSIIVPESATASPVQLPSIEGVEHRRVSVNDAELHLACAGDGPPLLLLHGWPQHWWCWRHVIPTLAHSRRVIAPDLRGWGWSQAPPGDYAKSTFAADVLALLDAEGLDRVSVIGHDW